MSHISSFQTHTATATVVLQGLPVSWRDPIAIVTIVNVKKAIFTAATENMDMVRILVHKWRHATFDFFSGALSYLQVAHRLCVSKTYVL